MEFGGYLYGTTSKGGASGLGTVFRVGPTWAMTTKIAKSFTVIYSFHGGTDGATPYAGLIAVNGKLYGTTVYGGPSNNGTVYEITP